MSRLLLRPIALNLGLCLAVTAPGALFAQDDARQSVVAAAVGQYTATTSQLFENVPLDSPVASFTYPYYDSTMIILPVKPDTVGTLLVWRIPPPMSHGVPLTMATWPGGLLRLGGFPESELWGASRALHYPVRSSAEAWTLARMLALLDAPTAPSLVLFPDDANQSQSDSAVVAWHAQRPVEFQADTVIARPDGSYTVRITRLAFMTYQYGPGWSHGQYTFQLGHDGDLLGIRRTPGREFRLRAPAPWAALKALQH